jgi:hypothetical protein
MCVLAYKLPRVVFMAAAGFVVLSCKGGSAKDVWSDFLKQCTGGDQVNMSTVLFFTFSNTLGPGTVWRHSEFTKDYLPVDTFDLTAAKNRGLLNPGNESECTGASVTTTNLGAGASVDKLVKAIPLANLAGRIRKSRKVTVKANTWAWDQLLVGPYERMIEALPDNDPYKQSALKDSLIAGRTVRLNGLEAEVEFSSAVADTLKAELPGNIGGELGLTGTWTRDQTLQLKATKPAYVGVQFWKLKTTGFAGLIDTTAVPIEAEAETGE